MESEAEKKSCSIWKYEVAKEIIGTVMKNHFQETDGELKTAVGIGWTY